MDAFVGRHPALTLDAYIDDFTISSSGLQDVVVDRLEAALDDLREVGSRAGRAGLGREVGVRGIG